MPSTDPFSTFGEGKPWVAYSWLFDVLVYALYAVGGLRGIMVYQFILGLAILLSVQHLVMLVEGRVTRAAARTAFAYGAMTQLLGPRSYLVSILFFILILIVVVTAYRSCRPRLLFLVPPLFVLWANIHIQFLYGLAILGVVTIEAAWARWWQSTDDPRLPLSTVLAVDMACLLATLVNPYHGRLYLVAYGLAEQTGVYRWILELQAMSFREPQNWMVLGLTLGAAFVLSGNRHPRFLTLLFVIGIFVSFRSNRDVWFVVVCATLIVAMAGVPETQLSVDTSRASRGVRWRAVLVAVLTFAMVLSAMPQRALEARVRREFPDAAAHAVEAEGYTGPLYNHFNWGGYLIWRLPRLSVSMDGRSNVHGDERIVQSMRTWAGVGKWQADPDLSAARVVIASVDMPLASLLRRDERFRQIYSDDIARVFVAKTRSAAADTRPRDAMPDLRR